METEPTGFWADPHAWVLLSTIVFAVIAYIKGKKPLLDMLDGRTKRIKHDLEEAARLKNEAQALLADYQKKHKDAVTTAQKIIDNAQESAALLQKSAEEKLPSHSFMRIHRSFMISLDKIESVQNNTVRIGKMSIPVTENYRAQFKNFLQHYF